MHNRKTHGEMHLLVVIRMFRVKLVANQGPVEAQLNKRRQGGMTPDYLVELQTRLELHPSLQKWQAQERLL